MIDAPSTTATGVRHDRRGSPSTSTVHVPQPPCWQPAFGLVISSSSRSTCRSARERRARDLVLAAVDGQPHAIPTSSSARRDEHDEHLAAVRGASRRRRRPDRRPSGRPRACGSARRRARAPPSGRRPTRRRAGRRRPRDDRDVRDRVRVRVPAAQRLRRPRAGRPVELDLEHEPARCGRPRGSPRPARCARRPCRRADTRAERDQRRAEIAALRLVARGRAEVAADRRRRAAPRRRRPAARSARAGSSSPSASAATGTIAPIRTTFPSAANLVEAAAVEHQRTRRASAVPPRSAGRRIVPPANTVMSVAVAEELRPPRRRNVGMSASAAMPDLSLAHAVRVKRVPNDTLRSSRAVRLDRRARVGAHRSVVPHRPRALDRALPLAEAREAAAPRRRGRRRQDRGGEGDRAGARRTPDPAAVLRGPRRRARGLRVELRAAAAAHPRRAGGNGRRGGALRPRVPDPAAAARGDRGGRAGRAPDRRDRPRRRGVRGVPARGALGLPDHRSRARHDRGEAAPAT